MSSDVQEFAPAKVNLCLHVTGRRSDGYHLLDSVVAFANVGDQLSFSKAQSFSLSIAGPFGAHLEAEADNLILRAARGFGSSVPGAKIHLDKRLPVAGGIGGGSADAAAALRGLMSLHEIDDLSESDVDEMALALGADVPACYRSRVLRMSGIGEVIEPLAPLPPAPALLVNPLVPVPTGPVFSEIGLRPGEAANDGLENVPDAGFASVQELANWVRQQRNDLEPPAISLVPKIADVLDQIRAQPGCLLARMSGSGATCFGLFESKQASATAEASLQNANPDWWSVATGLS